MQAIRIEHALGWGMFRAEDKDGNYINDEDIVGDELSEMFKRHYADFPIPQMDSGILREPEDDEFCAFKSLEQLDQWVTPDEIRELIKRGFTVFIIELEEATIGEYQILYKKEDVLAKLEINDLYNNQN